MGDCLHPLTTHLVPISGTFHYLSVVVYLSIANEECVQVVGILEGLLTLTCFIVYGKSFMAKDVMTMLLALLGVKGVRVRGWQGRQE